MIPLVLALALLPAGPVLADQPAAPAEELLRLERTLDERQDALKHSRLSPERYRDFELLFRETLAAAAARAGPSPANTAVHARIMTKLGDHAEALAALDAALRRDSSEASLLSAKGELLMARGDYAGAARLARQAWDGSGRTDARAFALLRLSEGRGPAPGTGPSTVAAPSTPSDGSRPSPDAPGTALPLGFKTSAAAPPAPGARPLDPRAPDYWDRQLLEPLLARSDANLVAREYLSPLIRDGKVTIRVVSEPSMSGAWGTYDLTTSVIKYNLDAINHDLREYNAYYSRRDPGRVLSPISPHRPLDAKQIEFLTGRFLPLAVHEAGGHGSHAVALRSRLGTRSAPMNKDTEIMAWRLEAASIAAERRRDPNYLTEPTAWARGEHDWMKVWRRSRERGAPEEIESYLDGMPSYTHLPNVSQDPKGRIPAIQASVSLVQTRCKARYDTPCASAVGTLTSLFSSGYQAYLAPYIARMASHPDDARLRAEVMNVIFRGAVVNYRLDPKGISVVTAYYNEQEGRVAALENAADPQTRWQTMMSLFRR